MIEGGRSAAVVGCGIGGMAAALALARRGWTVELFEAFAEPRPVGSGLLLQPSGLRALESLGLDGPVRASAARIERLAGWDERGRVALDIRYRHWRREAFGLGVHRAVLFAALHDALPDAGVVLTRGARIARVEHPARPVLHDEAGRSFGPFDLLVAADGAGSILRAGLRPRAEAPVNTWGAFWVDCPDPERRFAGALSQRYRRAEVMVGVLPLGLGPDPVRGPLASLFWSLPRAQMAAVRAAPFEDWRRAVLAVWPEVEPLLAGVTGWGQVASAVYRDVSVGRWNEGACVLIGDAAHGASPQLGQGASMALIDAVELGERLARPAAFRPARLIAYQRSRRLHVAPYQTASRAFTPMFQSHGRFWPTVRDRLFTPMSRLPGIRALAAAFLVGAVRIGRGPRRLRP